MGASTFGVGLIPLKLNLSKLQLNNMSLFSMGILIGTSIVIILPEGVEMLSGSLDKKEEVSKYIGLPILIGFVLMFVLENSPVISYIGGDYSFLEYGNGTNTNIIKSITGSSITIGLVVHGLVDGISLGSSFSKNEQMFKLLIFLAIIVHKLPTAFSLVSILIHEGINDDLLYWHIFVFAMSTPIASLVTFAIVAIIHKDNEFIIGILLLFSGGTFLYVVNHVIGEMFDNHKAENLPVSVESDGTYISQPSAPHSHPSMNLSELGLSLLGIVIPLILSITFHE
ncbi:uncharacterized protein J8A68_003527 [[Candida] subhashii]|uniref:Uncharacterized protein n=1 Tax=[Candida] subhashii TaxID=561895 RepID=A0A8J5QH39_9ASCO|nr:uncharacterized protein J8A68_003527 [[Candida] subhashii]KAG7662937.1 hypothetical protein J8A68_003527 [[Candida] subhashii]